MVKNDSGWPYPGIPELTDARSLLSVKTQLGLCGVGFIGGRVGRVWLPGGNGKSLQTEMCGWAGSSLRGRKGADAGHSPLADAITSYFEGSRVSFKNVQVALPGFSSFAHMVLERLCKVEWGTTVTYKDIATSIDNPGAARAIGLIMSKNPIPLIIPCHRVIRSDGGLGGFSGQGGVKMKQKMLELEGCGK
jgi:O-6-methylguanine DNA methyltransferase